MEYAYEMELDPVQWQSTQKQVLGDVFRDAPAPPPPSLPAQLPVRTNGTRNVPYGVKRKRQGAPNNNSQRSPDSTRELIERLGRGLSACIPVNPARRNTRVASAGAVMLGPSVGASTSKSTVMPPPKLKIPKPVAGPSSLDKATTPLSDAESFNWSKTESLSSAAATAPVDLVPTSASSSRRGSSSSSSLTTSVLPSTPPNRLSNSRPTSMPTLSASTLISPEQDTASPPSPPSDPRPVLSIRTKSSSSSVRVDASAFSARSDSTSTTDSNATATTVPEDQVSPVTPGARRASLPIIDLTFTPTPSPPSAPKPPQTRSASKAPPAAVASGSSRQAPPTQAPVSRPAPAPTRSTPSEPQPPRAPVQPPARAQAVPSQKATTTSRPASQQWPRVFPSSQTRLGLGAMGKGYDAASRPFRVPNKGKSIPLTVTALPLRGRIGTSAASSAGKAKVKSPAKPSAAGRLNFAPAPAAPASPTKRKENSTTGSAGKGRKEPMGRKTPTPVGRATTTRGATTTVSRTAASSKARKEPSSDTESYFASDTSFDDDELEAAMAKWDDD
ncbi:hypothetical protein FRC10_010935 [Ceratobasidium sp. 414]|nr:hypothetical protein FRC10_010935 [Ceratobasidium sp. 414]